MLSILSMRRCHGTASKTLLMSSIINAVLMQYCQRFVYKVVGRELDGVSNSAIDLYDFLWLVSWASE